VLTLARLALTAEDTQGGTLPGFAAATKTTDSRYQWFLDHYGPRCWEVDALSPPILRARGESSCSRGEMSKVSSWTLT
jgi:hypothetical protein